MTTAIAVAVSTAAASLVPLEAARAQGANAAGPVLQRGDAVVTGFSGIRPVETKVPAGENPLDYFSIDSDGPAAQILSLRSLPGGPQGQLVTPPPKLRLLARDIGQVFAIALDDARDRGGAEKQAPDIYLGQASAYGLYIVKPDGIAPGVPRRLVTGEPGAQWMAGQFGSAPGPGTIWRVDGTTGDIAPFAAISTNSGAGFGDIVFEPRSRAIFASDLDSGLIHRVGPDGRVIDSFDHGLAGRPARGLTAISDDGRVIDITSPSFDTTKPETWGLTQPARRVGGMAVHQGRLYYAVMEGAEIWSVGLGPDGAFDAAARFEVAVVGRPAESLITDIAFDAQGRMLLAERGQQRASYDFSTFAEPNGAGVLRYKPLPSPDASTPGLWLADPDEYAIGLGQPHRAASGGLALGYGHHEDGRLNGGRCNAMLWSTGDRLRAGGLEGDGEESSTPEEMVNDVHGLQGNDVGLVRPQNVPPQQAYFADYDGLFGDAEKAGHVGDVEIWQPCAPDFAEATTPLPPGFLPPGLVPPELPPVFPPPEVEAHTNLRLTKRTLSQTCSPWAGGWLCRYRIRVRNTGPDTYVGPIVVDDWLPAAPAGALAGFAAAPWNCWATGGAAWRCLRPGTVLVPGASVSLNAAVWVPRRTRPCRVQNVAGIVWAPGGSQWNTNPGDDVDGATATIPAANCDPEERRTNLRLTKSAVPGSCFINGGSVTCDFRILVQNTGPGVFNGPITVRDVPMVGASTVFAPQPLWSCAPAGAGTNCTRILLLNPGQGRLITVAMTVPRPILQQNNCRMDNRARIISPVAPSNQNFNPGDDSDTANISLPSVLCYRPVPQRCPPGFGLVDGQCERGRMTPPPIVVPPVLPPVVTPTCPPGTVGRFPNCREIERPECPKGTVGRYPNCREVERPECPKGTVGRYPNCREVERPECPEGTVGRYPNCRKIERPCPRGTVGTYPNCRPIVRECPPGTVGRFPACRPIVLPQCPEGTVGRYPNCLKVDRQCPKGTVGVYPRCRPIVRECPPGTAGRFPACRPIVLPQCPAGTVGRYPNCRKVERHCPPGTTGRYPRCRPVVDRKCPVGMVGRPPNCRLVVRPQCPRGTVGRYPNCRRPHVTRPRQGERFRPGQLRRQIERQRQQRFQPGRGRGRQGRPGQR